MEGTFDVRRYTTADGVDVIGDWMAGLKDRRARAKVVARLARLIAGNFGDCKPLRHGVWELRIDWGPGYRVYYALNGRATVVLLCGGDKRKQASDIRRAVAYWEEFKQRNRNK